MKNLEFESLGSWSSLVDSGIVKSAMNGILAGWMRKAKCRK